jgi:hypothetical protein
VGCTSPSPGPCRPRRATGWSAWRPVRMRSSPEQVRCGSWESSIGRPNRSGSVCPTGARRWRSPVRSSARVGTWTPRAARQRARCGCGPSRRCCTRSTVPRGRTRWSDWCCRCCSAARRPRSVLLAMRDCGRLRHRPLLCDLLGQVREGVQSPLELRYRRDVERAHGLPSGARNRPERVGGTGAPRYRDVRYRGYSLVVELDGEAAHPLELRWRDRLRDNDTALAGDMTLRYGWVEIVTRRCLVAAQVAGGLRRGGWSGEPRGCGPACALGRSSKPLVA